MFAIEQKKMGRPTDNPKSNPVHVRLDRETLEILERYCAENSLKRTEAIRHGIKMLANELRQQ